MNEVAIPEASVAKYTSDEAFDDIAKASSFLPRFNLFGSNSGACKEEKIGIGCYGYTSGDKIIDCGKEVRGYVLSVRLKAMRISDDKIETFFNPNDPEFIKIREESQEKDTGSLCGPEFLLYLSEKKVFVTFFMATKTMRREAPNVRTYCPRAVGKNGPDDVGQPALPFTLRSTLIKKGSYAWHGPVTTGCSIPLDPPPQDVLAKELYKFNNPPEAEASASAEEAAATNRAR